MNNRFTPLFLIGLVLSFNSIYGQEILSFLEGKVTFHRPLNVTRWEERPQFTNVKEQSSYWKGKIQLATDVYDAKELNSEPPTVMSKELYDLARGKNFLSRSDLLNLFNSKNDFVLERYNQHVDMKESYVLLRRNGEKTGEAFFHANAIDMKASIVYGYTICCIVDAKVFNIYLSYTIEDDFYVTNKMNNYFVLRGSNYYWKDEKSILAFYECLSSAGYKNLPIQLQRLREAYDTIITTLTVDGTVIQGEKLY
ncbi:MAG: hypothetical protein LBK62_06355 [Treponema sp.]|jgi:hypothetical protein|nr:hypothetical protein [Treponema sp.]